MAKKHLALRILLHVAPLIPIPFGRYYAAAALALLVCACYIKTFKLSKMLESYDATQQQHPQVQSLKRAHDLWKSFTFLA
jgi:hypothetical protein